MRILFFIDTQQGHLWSIHSLALSCLQTAQMHPCFSNLLRVSVSSFSRFDLKSTYNQRKITGIPRAKKIIIARAGTCNTINEKANNTVPTPRVISQRFVRLSIGDLDSAELPDIFRFLQVFSSYLFCSRILLLCVVFGIAASSFPFLP